MHFVNNRNASQKEPDYPAQTAECIANNRNALQDEPDYAAQTAE